MNESAKKAAALAALAEVQPDMLIGLGTGSTAKLFVDALGQKVRDGLKCTCVPTSLVTHAQAEALNIPLTTLEEAPHLDLTIDGADEVDPDLTLIKGAGGALLREKIVAAASDRMIVIADASKIVSRLGAFPLPIEVNAFGLGATALALEAVGEAHGAQGEFVVRRDKSGEPYRTDGGHLIIDASFGLISDAKALSTALLEVPGVVQHGLFIGMCAAAYIADETGVKVLGRPPA